MSCHLRADLYAATSGGRTIFLDARANRYFAIAPDVDAAFQRLQHAPASPADAATLRSLVVAGLVIGDPGETGLASPAKPSAPTAALDEGRDATWPALLRSALAQLQAAYLLRRRTLVELGMMLAARRRRAEHDGLERRRTRLIEQAAAFNRADLLFQPLDRCLPRSLAFCLLALKLKIPARLVIGVRANPFAAHAWVQHGEEVLNDTIEQVRQFEPILAL